MHLWQIYLRVRLDFKFLSLPRSFFETLEKNIWQSTVSALHILYRLAVATLLIMQNSMGSNKI